MANKEGVEGASKPGVIAAHIEHLRQMGTQPVQATIPGFEPKKEMVTIDKPLLLKLQQRLSMLILLTPSGELRNEMTNDSIALLDVLYP